MCGVPGHGSVLGEDMTSSILMTPRCPGDRLLLPLRDRDRSSMYRSSRTLANTVDSGGWKGQGHHLSGPWPETSPMRASPSSKAEASELACTNANNSASSTVARGRRKRPSVPRGDPAQRGLFVPCPPLLLVQDRRGDHEGVGLCLKLSS